MRECAYKQSSTQAENFFVYSIHTELVYLDLAGLDNLTPFIAGPSHHLLPCHLFNVVANVVDAATLILRAFQLFTATLPPFFRFHAYLCSFFDELFFNFLQFGLR